MSSDVCSEKMVFDSKKDAQDTARISAFKYGESTKLKAYKCKKCQLWHLATRYKE